LSAFAAVATALHAAAALTPASQSLPLHLSGSPLRAAAPISQAEAGLSRRSVLLGTSAATIALSPAIAHADSIEEIAARANAASEAARVAAAAAPEEEKTDGKGLVLGALFGSVALSLPFYWKNVARLAIKLTGGGDGYDKIQ